MPVKLLPLLFALAVFNLAAQQPAIDFNKQVQPILTENCTGCHKGTSAPAGLHLDTAPGLMKGSASGGVIVPGKSQDSLLIQRISDTTGGQMPPSGPLSKDQIRIISDWVDQGAKADAGPIQSAAPQAPAGPPPPSVSVVTSAAAERSYFQAYCFRCHSGAEAEAGMELDKLDTAHVEKTPDKWEKVVRKLRAGMMPPSGNMRPDAKTYEAMIVYLENDLDKHKITELPPPGIHRMNRTEYANSIRDLLALDIDPSKYLPSDDSTRGFDNIAGALSLSPALLEGYATAAEKIAHLAIGDANEETSKICRVPEDSSQDYHIDGMPFGTRGGLICNYEFPADGDYRFKIYPINQGLMDNDRAFGEIRGEKLELLVDGERVKLYDWDREIGSGTPVHGGTADVHFHVGAGPHKVVVTFLATDLAPGSDLNEHFKRSTIETGGLPGFKFWPHVGKLDILGPTKATVATDSVSRAKIFFCKPAAPGGQETACARQIVSTLARRAFRRPVTASDIDMLMSFYQQGYAAGPSNAKFDTGIEMALERILADPEFVFRREAEPVNLTAGKIYRISDLELASRLSFFLWSSIPDDQLIVLASQNKLHDPATLEAQVKRMLADPKSDQLVLNFAGQWLNLRGMQSAFPIPGLFPDWDDNLRTAMRKEAELFVGNVVHEDRSVIDLLNGNYTFLNERLAKHYGIPGVYGSNFRRVELPPEFDMRRGLLGKGAIQTIGAGAPDRTSPTKRGKAMMQIFLGVSPPDPPPNIPEIKAGDATHSLTKPTMRQQIEMHRKNEPCATCHKIMDPIGLALENFDAIGKWRVTDDGSPIDVAGMLVDGTKIDGTIGLRDAFIRYTPQFVRVITDKLMIYALGRGTEYFDMPEIRAIVHNAEKNDYRFSTLVLGVVKSEQFQRNQRDLSSLIH
jgi:Protein of unknown function (DUF1592)/Protein of unknown function (DUF1588)/Protein of unknown function (DUF1587)/Protein of unknown function (DUF1585)/Protein of unknown function (DUF1595)/Planctomycete cytochrome C/Cytochrome C oxidase, cbb3-type, subunit III